MGGQALESLGYTVSIRTSSIEALELFRTKPNDFDLVITDMTMPNMTGDRLAIELMKIRPDIPVILCTGYSKKISDESALEMGIKAFIYKIWRKQSERCLMRLKKLSIITPWLNILNTLEIHGYSVNP